jgi:outer membrane protein assembly factor BamB
MIQAKRTILTLATASTQLHAQVSFDRSNSIEPKSLDATTGWTHFAGDAKRNSITHAPSLPSLAQTAWVNTDHITIPQTGLVIDDHHVYALTRDATNASFATALDRSTGEEVWSMPIAPPILDSWSTPVIDTEHRTLIVTTGASIVALDADTGDEIWSRTINTTIVNASPVVTHDLGDRDRVLITTYSFGFGEPAQLICINTDPFDEITNPFEPGDIVWSLQLNADSSGNTPAYQNGRLYLATASDGISQRGTVRCYDITGDTAPDTPLWMFTNTINAGFFGGVSIAKGHVYASSYAFTGLQTSANTIKLNKLNGSLAWSVPTNRTDATPIVLPTGDVVVSSGVATGAFDFLPFFGSLPSVQFIDDQGSTAITLWDSALSTHEDLNTNGIWDFGEPYLSIGGWTHQPLAIRTNAIPHLLVGSLPETQPGVNIDHNTTLSIIDLTKTPVDPGFIVEQSTSTGDTPAYASGWIYSSGAGGIMAFAPPSPETITLELVNRYTSGELTINQLLERLPK